VPGTGSAYQRAQLTFDIAALYSSNLQPFGQQLRARYPPLPLSVALRSYPLFGSPLLYVLYAKAICNAILAHAVEQDERLRQLGEEDRVDDKTAFVIKRTH
jgi:hypothetical protein